MNALLIDTVIRKWDNFTQIRTVNWVSKEGSLDQPNFNNCKCVY